MCCAHCRFFCKKVPFRNVFTCRCVGNMHGIETLGTRPLYFLQQFMSDFFLTQYAAIKTLCIALHSIFAKTNLGTLKTIIFFVVRISSNHTPNSRVVPSIWSFRKHSVTHCNLTNGDKTVGNEYLRAR